jgi:hypothetical protein
LKRRQQLEFRTRSRRDGTGSMMLWGRDGSFVAFFLEVEKDFDGSE